MINLIDQGLLARNISEWKKVQPAFYHGHVVFFDFTKFLNLFCLLYNVFFLDLVIKILFILI